MSEDKACPDDCCTNNSKEHCSDWPHYCCWCNCPNGNDCPSGSEDVPTQRRLKVIKPPPRKTKVDITPLVPNLCGYTGDVLGYDPHHEAWFVTLYVNDQSYASWVKESTYQGAGRPTHYIYDIKTPLVAKSVSTMNGRDVGG